MYSLVIADDEKNICAGIRAAIESACPEITIAAEFHDGGDLLQYLKTAHADILVCDIRMGTVSGLDIAKFIYEHKSETRIILITGFRMFEYAQQAINYHVNSFLTKPFASKELINALKKIEQELDANLENAINSKKSLLSDWNTARQNVQKLFRGTWSGTPPILDLDFFPAAHCRAYELCYILDSEPDPDAAQKTLENIAESAMDLGEFSSASLVCFYCGFADNELYFTAFAKTELDPALPASFIAGMRATHGLSFSSSYKAFATPEIYRLFCTSRRLVEESMRHLSGTHKPEWDGYLTEMLSGQTAEQLTEICRYLRTIYAGEPLPLPAAGKNAAAQIKNFLITLQQAQQTEQNPSDLLVEQTKHFIATEYADYNLSLYHIADKLSVNPDYLSRLFKQKNGQGFSSLLLKTRMEKAMELLLTPSMRVADIAEAVGYNDLSYFKRSFKSYTGVSPAEYRNIKR